MNIVYETNGKGYLGWIIDLPGAYVRGESADKARSKILQEINDYDEWLGIRSIYKPVYNETFYECNLSVEDADSDIIFDTEIDEYKDFSEFEHWCGLAAVSGAKAQGIYENCRCKNVIDPRMVRKTFYGDVYSTINKQFDHIINVQNYYLAQIGSNIKTGNGLPASRKDFTEELKRKYRSEGNRLYKNKEEDWTIKKIIRRIIWHDRIHSKAISRMEQRLCR